MTPKRLLQTGVTAVFLLLLGRQTLSFVRATGGAAYEPDQVVVKLDPVLGLISDINLTYGTAVLATLPYHSDIYLLSTPPSVDVEQLVQVMGLDPRLVYAELNYINETPEDGSTNRTYGWGGDSGTMHNQTAAHNMDLAEVHTVSQGENTLVAVLDTGVQSEHPELTGSFSPLGYDFVDNDIFPDEETNGQDDDEDGLVDELYGHGTHVTGIVHLVAPGALIMPVRVLDTDGRGNIFRTAGAILYAAYNGADAINLSLGTSVPSALLREAVEEATSMEVVVVAAAGNLNSESPQYPAAESCAIAVTSIDRHNHKSSFANYGLWIGVATPGEDIHSTVPDGYGYWSGTSMSTPFVTGQASLLRGLNPALTLDEIGSLIGDTATSLDLRNPAYTGLLGQGKINMSNSLDAATGTIGSENNLFAGCNP